ncbi:MAG TPA: hypothetical protein VHD62_19395 [Opitutaceae bacterium]|nr:hypothetical protein [Opitutaceae bacterium]
MKFLAALLLPLAVGVAAEPAPVALHWLGDAAPAAPDGVSWGVPWPKGALQKNDPLALKTADGTSVPVQSWPLAYWPDGSIKWTGEAIAVNQNAGVAPGGFTLSVGAPAAAATPLKISENADAIEIDTGAVRARLPKHGSSLIASLVVGDRTVAQDGKLILQLEDRSRYANERILREEDFVSRVDSATLEQSGPIRAVVKITGTHKSTAGERAWLPFSVRLYFFAGSGAIKLTHTIIFDGDAQKDFIKGLGLSFAVPFKEELHNRHLRFVGDGDGVWVQPVRMLPGYRSQTGQTIGQLYADHLGGKRVPNLADLDARTRDAILSVPIWSDAKLTQLNPNGWSIAKRTATPDSSWLHVMDGHRARGLAVLADVSGGLAVGVKDFWQKAPASFEVTGGASAVGELKIWLWSPDADAMDLRRYDDIPHGLSVNYEDWKPGWGSPYGIANTHDLTLWAFGAIPSDEQLVALSRAAAEPPMLVCTPEYYHAQQALGRWSLPDRSTPALNWVEDQVQGLVDFYHGQVEERSWYGFWDFGDIMHNYDFGRHEWRYDVGGWAWANTELMPDMLLWYSFLRTGRADIFRMAEAMTRHTSEVDNYHMGPFFPLGSRHNVNHWGDGSKQPRESHAGLKRQYYFLSGGDGRLGDLLRDQIDADLTYDYVSQFNSSHYSPDEDGTPRLDGGNGGAARGGRGGPRGGAATARPNPPAPVANADASPSFSGRGGRVIPAPRPENFAPRRTAADRQPFTRFGLEWLCYSLNWTTEWERGGDQTWRARVESDMKAMAASVDAEGKFPGRYFDMIFGGPENMNEMQPMYDVPEFWKAWANTSAFVGRQTGGNEMTAPRMLAYAANAKNDAELGRMAWEKLIGPAGKLPPPARPKKITGPELNRPVTDPAFLGAPVQWQQHGVASVQWALNAIETLEFAKQWLPAWEHPQPKSAAPASTPPATAK